MYFPLKLVNFPLFSKTNKLPSGEKQIFHEWEVFQENIHPWNIMKKLTCQEAQSQFWPDRRPQRRLSSSSRSSPRWSTHTSPEEVHYLVSGALTSSLGPPEGCLEVPQGQRRSCLGQVEDTYLEEEEGRRERGGRQKFCHYFSSLRIHSQILNMKQILRFFSEHFIFMNFKSLNHGRCQ